MCFVELNTDSDVSNLMRHWFDETSQSPQIQNFTWFVDLLHVALYTICSGVPKGELRVFNRITPNGSRIDLL